MISRTDLNVVDSFTEHGETQIRVEHDGNFYSIGACDMTEDDVAEIIQLDPLLGILLATGAFPTKETYVMAVDEDGIPLNECNEEQCSTGVCNKRIATNTNVGDIEVAWNMLMSYLNS